MSRQSSISYDTENLRQHIIKMRDHCLAMAIFHDERNEHEMAEGFRQKAALDAARLKELEESE